MKIRHTISGPKRNSTYGQEMTKSREILENILREENKQWLEYILAIAKIKEKGDDLSIGKVREICDKVGLTDELKKEMVLNKNKMRVNLYLNSLSPPEAKKLIEEINRKN